jgi:MFS family permease
MKATRVRHTVTALAVSLAVLAYMQRVAISQAAAAIQADLGLDKAQLGLVFGAFGLSYALFEIPSGALGDRFGARTVLLRIVVAWSAFTALTGAAWSFASLWTVRFLFGAGEAGCFPNLTRMLGVWLPRPERIRAQSLLWACGRWGGAITPPLVLLAMQGLGWRWTFVVLALLGVLWVAVFQWWYRDDPAQHPALNSAERDLLKDVNWVTGAHEPGAWRRVLGRWVVAALLLQYFCYCFVWYFYVTWLPSYLIEAHHQTPAQAAGFAVLPLLLGGCGSLVSGFLVTRIRPRVLAMIAFLTSAAMLCAVTQMHSVMGAMVAMAIASFFSDLTTPISWNACVELGGRYTGTLSGAMNMFGNLAGFVSPVVGGFILQRAAGNWNVLVYLMIGFSILAALCWLFLDPDRMTIQGVRASAAPVVARSAGMSSSRIGSVST